MNIMQVMKKENLGKEYAAEGIEFVLIEGISILWLENKETHEDIEEMFNLNAILQMEFKEIVDWSKIPVDTKILVSDNGEDWIRRYFAKYEGGRVYAFYNGTTSFTGSSENLLGWAYAKLYEE